MHKVLSCFFFSEMVSLKDEDEKQFITFIQRSANASFSASHIQQGLIIRKSLADGKESHLPLEQWPVPFCEHAPQPDDERLQCDDPVAANIDKGLFHSIFMEPELWS